jgi:hypothetical protein
LNAAIIADVDIIISGDKHFHELTLSHPIVMSAFEFVKEYVAALNDEGQ